MLFDRDLRVEQRAPAGERRGRVLRGVTKTTERGEHRPRPAREKLIGPGEQRGKHVGDATARPEAAIVRRGHVFDARGQPVGRPEICDRASAHHERHVTPWCLLLGYHPHGGDARSAGDEEQIACIAPHDERGPQRSQQIERITRTAFGDPLSAGAERLHDELDLPRAAVDPAERVGPPQQGIPAHAWAHVHELPGVRLRRDVWRADQEQRSKITDLRVGYDAALLDQHGASLADGNGGAEAPPFR